ncbi:er membrane protein complex subunit 3 [Anaeramoeba flamelloides]|uniref:ER membrane protein complex subunit 3 n=1 Tax=Anaeramoeba flamelloides TaxID=1746091 RepID=A0ABQ8YLP8_9EUKA|nr:er membrane protein complex subunit 3 [Anaeramoeba flamelloides]
MRLDPQIRDWVLFPIVIIVFLVSVIRHYLFSIIPSQKPAVDKDTQGEQQLLIRSNRICKNANMISKRSFISRQPFFLDETNGELNQDSKQKPLAMSMMFDPSMMTNMMKGSMGNMIPQVVLGQLISYLFKGFLVVKLPFFLPARFKAMLQQGIGLSSLDSSFVSSLSWYFMVYFGLSGIINLLFQAKDVMVHSYFSPIKEQMRQIQVPRPTPAPAPTPSLGNMGGTDKKDTLRNEKENWKMIDHWFDIQNSELELIGKPITHGQEKVVKNQTNNKTQIPKKIKSQNKKMKNTSPKNRNRITKKKK